MPHRLHEAIVALLHALPQTVPGILVVTGDLPAATAADASQIFAVGDGAGGDGR